MKSSLLEMEMSLADILKLKPGDIIPIDMPNTVVLEAEEIPLFRGTMGVSRGNTAVKITDRVKRKHLNFINTEND